MEFSVNVFVLQTITFLIGMAISSVIFLPLLKGWMKSRQKRIQDQLDAAEARQKESEALRAELDRKMKDLDKNTSDILQKTRVEAAKQSEEMLQNSHKAAEQIISEARKAMDSERQAVVQSIQKEVGGLAVSIAEKILHSSVDAKAQEKLIQEGLKELNASKN